VLILGVAHEQQRVQPVADTSHVDHEVVPQTAPELERRDLGIFRKDHRQ
jgi:hypothetical protein